ncbi:MAG: beta-galactosidase trimerization domain-containing protein [Armatimonadetes bacterium]|nr:beta-galactosidase trimerization domain-containing protein [Armatimonadota bacterium]
MRFRQIHLDFHTSEAIEGIGASFTKESFQDALRLGHVDSITVFSKCHHGWAYHPSDANEIHPHLSFDLLAAQIEAAHQIGVKTPVYISAGLDEKEARRSPQWLIRNADDRTNWVDSFLKPGYHQFCLNSPYLPVLLAQIDEVVRRYDADGIFLDIVGVRDCVCHTCLAQLRGAGHDPTNPAHVRALGEKTYANYTRRVRETIDAVKPGLPVFHNAGHISQGRRDLATMNTHLELESLPTGGWGYDHFPLSARYAQGLGMKFLGMTGKFHTSWGEFGGFKHPNALRYEAALSIANGAKVSVGDQLHPSGLMDTATYALIGAAYSEVEAKEPWCDNVVSIADVALLSAESAGGKPLRTVGGDHADKNDAGAVRVLLESHILFDVVDTQSDFAPYKVVILPDLIRVQTEGGDLEAKLREYVAGGGKILATGQSNLNAVGDAFVLDLGATWQEPNALSPDYFRPDFAPGQLSEGAAFVFYAPGQRIALSDTGTALGMRGDSYFNRTAEHFCSHQFAPPSGAFDTPGMTEGADGIYAAWNLFDEYGTMGSLIARETLTFALRRLLNGRETLTTNLPAQGIVTLMEQPGEVDAGTASGYICHLLYASPVRRGKSIEVIEDILPMLDTTVTLRLPKPVTVARLQPSDEPLALTPNADGTVLFTVPRFECHQMIVLS